MYQRDYILRLIEELGAVLTATLQLRQRGQYQQALDTIDRTLEGLLGIDAERIHDLTAPQLIGLIRLSSQADRSGETTVGDRLNALGSLLQEQANIYTAQENEDEAAASAMKALQVYLAVLTEDDPSSAHAASSVEPLLRQLADYDLPPDVKELLWQHYELSGQFGKAEDWLFELLDVYPRPEGLVERGVAFYERLLAHDDETLEVGNLPRPEVEVGLAQLRASQQG
jgi:hypothetical protein